MNKYLYTLILFHFFVCCDDSSSPDSNSILNESDFYAVCNNIVVDCRDSGADYCLNYSKFGRVAERRYWRACSIVWS